MFSSDFQLDPNGNPFPVFVPGVSFIDYYPAIKGAVLNVDNNSLYVQDHWAINGRWSADLGARYEHVTASSTGGIVSIDSNRIVPRLAIGYDIKGNGDHTVHATYGQYAGRYDEAQVGQNSPVGNPPDIESLYQGPAGQGYGFAPGTNVAKLSDQRHELPGQRSHEERVHGAGHEVAADPRVHAVLRRQPPQWPWIW